MGPLTRHDAGIEAHFNTSAIAAYAAAFGAPADRTAWWTKERPE